MDTVEETMAAATKQIQCPPCVMAGALITSKMRRSIHGVVAGGAGSRKPEAYQRKMIIEGTGVDCPKTNVRINLRTHTLKAISQPNRNKDGFDYSEDFDGIQIVPRKMIYVNLKCISGTGGDQTRSLREVYWFIEGQLNVLLKTELVYFVNILDGDEAAKHLSKYTYLISFPEYESIKNRIYVGDLQGYFEWFAKTTTKE